jgi:plastocyanin
MSRPAGILALLVSLAGLALAADMTVVQKDRAFSVSTLAVKVGDQVVFVNQDTVNHNIYSETKGLEFDVLQKPGTSHTVRFAQPGVTEVRCAIHPVMKLEVRVTP